MNTDCRLSLVGVLLTFTQRGANKSKTCIVFTFSKNFKFGWHTFLSPFGLVCEKTASWNVYGQAPLALSAGDETQLPILDLNRLFSSLSLKLDGKSETFWGLIWPCFKRQKTDCLQLLNLFDMSRLPCNVFSLYVCIYRIYRQIEIQMKISWVRFDILLSFEFNLVQLVQRSFKTQ